MHLIILSFIIFLLGCPKKTEMSEESFHRYDLEEFDQLMEIEDELMEIEDEALHDLPEAIDETFDDTGDAIE